MSRDTHMKAEDGTVYSFENIRTQGYLDGHAPGLDAAVEYLKRKAVDLFTAGRDPEATALRKLAEQMGKDLRPDMEARAKRHEKDYPAEVT